MSTKKYVDINGLTRFKTKMEEEIPTKTSQLTNDSNFTTAEVFIGDEQDAPEDTKIIIDDEGQPMFNSEVVNSLSGNETAKAPSVSAVKSGIIESGSNANGSYIKFIDGTLICMNTIADGYAITTSWGSWYETANNSTAGATTFPIEFLNTPFLNATQNGNNVGGELGDISYDKTGISRVNWRRPNSSNYSWLIYSYVAIGRWK